MMRGFAVSHRFAIATGLSLIALTGCEQHQQMHAWDMNTWNWFGQGSVTKNYNLQYDIGQTQILNPAAASSINTNTRSSTYSRDYNLQYAVGPTIPVKQSSAPSWWSKPKPKPKPQPRPAPVVRRSAPATRRASSDAGATTYKKSFDLQYAIGSTQGVNGHKVAATRPTSSYERNYNLQYPIGHQQAVRRHRSSSFTKRPAARPWRPNRASGGTAMRSTGATNRGSGAYVVRPGDTLTSIARSQYGPRNVKRWPEILRANRGVINRADEIAPGMRLRIP